MSVDYIDNGDLERMIFFESCHFFSVPHSVVFVRFSTETSTIHPSTYVSSDNTRTLPLDSIKQSSFRYYSFSCYPTESVCRFSRGTLQELMMMMPPPQRRLCLGVCLGMVMSIIIVSWTSSIDAAGILVHNMNSNDSKDNNNHHYEKRERFPDLDHVDIDEANAVVQALRTHDMMDITTTAMTTSQYDGDHLADSDHGIATSNERDLQLDTILRIISTVCDLVGTLLVVEGSVRCDCNLTLSVDFACVFEQASCGPGGQFCNVPTVRGGFDFLQTRLSFGYCADQPTFNNVALPDFCIDVGGRLLSATGSSSSSSSSSISSSNSTSSVRSKEDRGGDKVVTASTKKRQFFTSINMTVGGRSCRSVALCNDGQGYQFDCTNVDLRMKQTTCAPLRGLSSLRQERGSIVFLPELDNTTTAIGPTPTSAPISSFFNLLLQLQKNNAPTPTASSSSSTTNTKKGTPKKNGAM
jgi:hypothetical protein